MQELAKILITKKDGHISVHASNFQGYVYYADLDGMTEADPERRAEIILNGFPVHREPDKDLVGRMMGLAELRPDAPEGRVIEVLAESNLQVEGAGAGLT
jgi:hypothetical protein